ncbi:MAG: hypothetical protein Q8880_11555 [Bacteroidota bacterium]|nr:hypothetical protein [Bacteroidota bacterium]
MSNKSISSIARINLLITGILMSSCIALMFKVKDILSIIKNYSIIKKINFSIISINVITNNETYSIKNIPLGIALFGVLYNIYELVKNLYAKYKKSQ